MCKVFLHRQYRCVKCLIELYKIWQDGCSQPGGELYGLPSYSLLKWESRYGAIIRDASSAESLAI